MIDVSYIIIVANRVQIWITQLITSTGVDRTRTRQLKRVRNESPCHLCLITLRARRSVISSRRLDLSHESQSDPIGTTSLRTRWLTSQWLKVRCRMAGRLVWMMWYSVSEVHWHHQTTCYPRTSKGHDRTTERGTTSTLIVVSHVKHVWLHCTLMWLVISHMMDLQWLSRIRIKHSQI